MAYRELSMIDVKEVLRRWQAEQSERRIARETGLDRKTVGRYIRWAVELELPRDRQLDDDEVHAVADCVQARPEPDPSAERRELAAHKERIQQWLESDKPLRLSKVHVLLQRDGVTASYATLRRFVMRELGWRKKQPTVRLDDPPAGQEAQVDFGKMGYLVDAETGRKRTLWVLIVTLAFSRYQFVWPTFVQTTEAICEGPDAAWKFFGAMPLTIVPDNMRGIVDKPDALTPHLCDAFPDYAQARGLFVDPARVRSPRDKARVENQVPYVRESWFDGESSAELDEARHSAADWCRDEAGRASTAPRARCPREVFEGVGEGRDAAAAGCAVRRAAVDQRQGPCRPSHPGRPRSVLGADAVSAQDRCGHVLTGEPCRSTSRHRADQGASASATGGRATDPGDYPVGKAAYALRTVDGVVDEARTGASTSGYAERIFAGPLPWARMRQGYALLRLCDRYGEGRVEAVCQSALAFDVIDVDARQTHARDGGQACGRTGDERKVVQLPLPSPLRTHAEHFETRPGRGSEEGVMRTRQARSRARHRAQALAARAVSPKPYPSAWCSPTSRTCPLMTCCCWCWPTRLRVATAAAAQSRAAQADLDPTCASSCGTRPPRSASTSVRSMSLQPALPAKPTATSLLGPVGVGKTFMAQRTGAHRLPARLPRPLHPRRRDAAPAPRRAASTTRATPR